jgi:hypothetical protein
MSSDPLDNPNEPNKELSRLSRNFLVFSGHVFVGLGVIGAILPLMPTTVFLLLAATCYAHSSPRFYNWLLHNKYFGSYIKNYKENRGTPLSVKITSIAILWITILISIYSTAMPWYVIALLIAIAVAVTIHLIRIKTLK